MSDESATTVTTTNDNSYAEFNRTYDYNARIFSYRPAYICIVNTSDKPLWAPYIGRHGRMLKPINDNTVTESSKSDDFIEYQMFRPAKGIRKRWSYRDKMAADLGNPDNPLDPEWPQKIDVGTYAEMVKTVRGIMNPIKEANGWAIETDEAEEPVEQGD